MQLNAQASTNNYSDNTYPGQFAGGYITPTENSILVTVLFEVPAGVRGDSLEDQYVQVGQSLNVAAPEGGSITSVAFKSAAAGEPADVYAYFGSPTELTLTVSVSGQTGPTPTVTEIAGSVSSAGAVVSGTLFTVTPLGAGEYIVNFEEGFFASPPVVVANCQRGDTLGYYCSTGNPTVAEVEIVTHLEGTGPTNSGFQFRAIAPP